MYERNNKDFGKTSSDLWYSDQRYAQFWQHYNTMMMTAHHDAIVKARYVAAHTKAALSNLHGSMYLHHNNHHSKYSDNLMHGHERATSHSGRSLAEIARSNRNRQKRKRKMRNRRLREWSCNSNQGVLSDTEILHSQMSQGMHIKDADDEEEESMEVTEDFLKFLEQSEKHREQWKVRKERLKSDGSVTPSEEPVAETEPKAPPLSTVRRCTLP
ncbi:gem-associated protein 8 isoform X2 [Procambarus clarkii]|uniref:gem-associated protein 8 isoform X2 n=1 Tax=Procambarus clarkii TaxID=6728 RepID=UPI0037436022